MRSLPLLCLGSLVAACGGSSVHTERAGDAARCAISVEPNDVTFVRDVQHGYAFSLPPPASWSLECIDQNGRLVRGENEEQDAAVSVSVDAEHGGEDERAHLQRYMRDARTYFTRQHMHPTTPRITTLEDSPIGVIEVRTRDDGETTLHVAAFSVLRTDAGAYLRFMVILPSDGRFGHGDDDPIVRRALATAHSFGSYDASEAP